ncbi:hypothetical protein [Paraburkholderia humisilvae]|uniref:Uncharacterized protein n=1 Tax=Paraburkholderia humisilvae TaxID=627669 RepID=A0A6J5F4X3_9BURK|nr:hypothetical protein [Paraburkholderia humisilvae]CAB3773524.1 hypothetical protein LMG29542_07278 [Paraburkholderia humisilvae]
MIRSALAERPDMLRVLDMIDRQASEIARLSEDLVDATRIGQGGLRLDKLNVDVATILADSCEIAASGGCREAADFHSADAGRHAAH